jgi:N-acetylglucosaminyldiphosphoundecaprenol N-acetyl-beta-D-mannosaminyltransferase
MRVLAASSFPDPMPLQCPVLGVPIDVLTKEAAVARIADWASRRESRAVCICNVHSVVTAQQNPAFMLALVQSDMRTPDGAPVAWLMRRVGAPEQRRVAGPDLMVAYIAHACTTGESVFLYGSTEDTLSQLQTALLRRWPTLRIAGALAPPFRELTPDEDLRIVQDINASGAGTVWVGLGCPKQELWMAAHRGRVQAVMVGVGAAFEFASGKQRRAPAWMRNAGLEWLYRLVREPRRLWRRYLVTNTAFVISAALQLLKRR